MDCGIVFHLCIISMVFLNCTGSDSQHYVDAPHITASSDIEAGRYLVTVAGGNDCHTDQYLVTGGDIPEEDWLAGSPLGWQGP